MHDSIYIYSRNPSLTNSLDKKGTDGSKTTCRHLFLLVFIICFRFAFAFHLSCFSDSFCNLFPVYDVFFSKWLHAIGRSFQPTPDPDFHHSMCTKHHMELDPSQRYSFCIQLPMQPVLQFVPL